MNAAILSIGDELTLGQTIDTNSAWLSARLAEQAILTVEHRTVADDRAALARTIAELSQRVEVLIITGGLGPTEDDLTREALGDALTPDQPLVTDDAVMEHLHGWFTRRGRSMPEMNRKQATRPATMRLMPNPNGTAPGLMLTEGSAAMIFSMPGPPREMQPMFCDHVLPAILTAKPESREESLITAAVLEFGMGESVAAEKLITSSGSLMDRTRNPLVGTTASESIVAARIRATGSRDWAMKEVDQITREIERLWHPHAFGRDGATLAEAVGVLLRERQESLAVAESCTGGWLGKAIVDLAGSSDYFRGGWIVYSDELKTSCLGVAKDLIQRHGAVSGEVASVMASGAARESGADWALSITGIAGPTGGTAEKPVGTVWIGLASGSGTSARRFEFPGDRTTVRDRSVKTALQMLRFALMGVDPQMPLIWEARTNRRT